MTYRQLMEIMGAASAMIQEGIVRQNPEMTTTGVGMILNHPAPRHKPWTIVAGPDQEEFKKTLLSYDQVLDAEATRVATGAAAGNWLEANQAAYALTNACISCHLAWKDRVEAPL